MPLATANVIVLAVEQCYKQNNIHMAARLSVLVQEDANTDTPDVLVSSTCLYYNTDKRCCQAAGRQARPPLRTKAADTVLPKHCTMLMQPSNPGIHSAGPVLLAAQLQQGDL
jgi:hypothetical protein